MYCKLTSCAIYGVDGLIIDVEVDVSDGLPSFDLVGLPDSAVREAKERVRSAIRNSGYHFPIKRITVNLAPADYKKEGAYYDLPIALGILCCMGIIEQSSLSSCMIVGELSLNGKVRPVKGILPIVSTAKDNNFSQCIIPKANVIEGALIQSIDIIGASTLEEVILHLTRKKICTPHTYDSINYNLQIHQELDFFDVKGQEEVKRALEIAAAGQHNVIMIGPPGSGKTMLANCIPSILPKLSFEESIEITKIYSICGELNTKNHIINTRPFRAPHHTTTPTALIGGGRTPKPGEASLAHNGVLFLDELLEFNKKSLDILRQPLEDHQVTISRVNASITFPANFMLVASTNPCPCGFYPNELKCQCSSSNIKQYLRKLSGALLDRIDIHIETQPVPYTQLSNPNLETSENIRKRVYNAIHIQRNRYKNDNILYNSNLSPTLLEKYCKLGTQEKELLKKAFHTLNLSARSYHRIIKVARTIADLDNSELIKVPHLAEAIQYRSLDRQH